MAQADFNCANATGAAFRADLNNQLLALATQSSGATTPSTTYAYQSWVDISGAYPILKIRNSSNSAWVIIGRVDIDSFGLAAPKGNKIINGEMAIDQRNNGSTHTITTAGGYGIDRFLVIPTGASVTGQLITSSANAGQRRYQITGAAGVTGCNFAQRIEFRNCCDLINGNATLSVEIGNSLLTTVTWSASYANAADNFTSQTTFASGSFGVSATVTQQTATFAVPAAAVTGIQITLSVGAQTSGVWTLGNMQLEQGSFANSIERKSRGSEIALCQRYYAVAIVGLRGSSVTGFLETTIKFPQTMRTTPTMTAYQASGYTSANVISETLRQYSSSESGYFLTGTANTDMYVVARGYILSAEL